MRNTKIEWADHTWSPWRGCTKVSPGCANCYAEALSRRNPAVLGEWGPGRPRVFNKNWDQVKRWNSISSASRASTTIFPSLCDWLDSDVPIDWLAQFLELIHDTPSLRWLLLTKRPENWDKRSLEVAQLWAGDGLNHRVKWLIDWRRGFWIPSNVWFGTSVEDQKRADQRIPVLLEIPAAVRWLSVEPLLGQVDLSEWTGICSQHHPDGSETPIQKPLHWIVVGGESGPKARPCSIEWIRSLVNQCKASETPVFVKQLGAHPIIQERELWRMNGQPEEWVPGDGNVPMRVKHAKCGDPIEWPEDLRVRQFPSV